MQVMRDENGNSRGFGFVSFEEHEAAVKVVLSVCSSVHFAFLVALHSCLATLSIIIISIIIYLHKMNSV